MMIPNLIIGKLAPPERRGEYFGFNSAIGSASFSIAPIIGTTLLYSFPHEEQMAWYIIAAVTFAMLCLTPLMSKSIEKQSKLKMQE